MKKIIGILIVSVMLCNCLSYKGYALSDEKVVTREILSYFVSADAQSDIFSIFGTMVYHSSQNRILELKDLYLGRYVVDTLFYHPGFNPDSVIIGTPSIINNGTCAIVTVTYQKNGVWTSEVLTFYP